MKDEVTGQMITYNKKSGKPVEGFNNKENIYKDSGMSIKQDDNI